MADLIRLSNDLVSGAQVTFVPDVARNPSEARISGRIAMRPVIREYMLSIYPKHSEEMVKIIMATRGARYPLSLRDYADNYILDDEEIPHTGTTATIGRTWEPATGTLSVFERILLVDESETSFVVKVNGGIPSPVNWSFVDYGKISIPGLTDEDVVTVSGQYLIPVCIVDSPSTSIITNSNGSTLHKFSDIRLEQIFEAELEKLV